MLNPYAKGDKVTFRTYVREWDNAAGRWVEMPYAHCEGTVSEFTLHGELIVVTDRGTFTVNQTRIVEEGREVTSCRV